MGKIRKLKAIATALAVIGVMTTTVTYATPPQEPGLSSTQIVQASHRKKHKLIPVYIWIRQTGDADSDDYFDQQMAKAVKAWNKTGATNFHITRNYEKASIYVKQDNSGSLKDDIGLTEFEPNGDVHMFIGTEAIREANDRLIATLEHELGHAAGLNHVKDKHSVMYYDDEYSHTNYITKANICMAKKTYRALWRY